MMQTRGMRKRRSPFGMLAAAALGALFLAAPASAEQFWVAWEGDEYPENQGWERAYGNANGPYQGGANRSLSDGIFTLDSLYDLTVCDFYEMERTVDPGPGEMFVAEWRVMIDARSDPRDVGAYIFRALSPGHAYFKMGPSSVYIVPANIAIGLEEGVYHSYRFESVDMCSYTLSIDDAITFNGYFEDFTLLQYSVSFGDGVQGQRSLSQWDYFRYGIVPEPIAAMGLLCVLVCSSLRRVSR